MPELPEVETMVRGLRPALTGRTILRLEVHDPHLLHGCSAEEIERRASGANVASVGRRGKWVVIALGGRRGLIVIQPRMTGGFWLVPPERPEHVRLTIELERSGGTVWFCDARRLGKIAWYDGRPSRPRRRSAGHSHGPDATEIVNDDLAARLKRTTRAIKPTLMDQKVLAGIGNIYADESLFRARIHPERPAPTLLRATRSTEAPRGDRRRAGAGDRGRRFELRCGLPDRARAGGRIPCRERHVRPGRAALPGVRRGDRQDEDRRPDRAADALLPGVPAAGGSPPVGSAVRTGLR